MRQLIVLMLALLAVVALAMSLSFTAPVLVPLTIALALLVAADPRGIGARIRGWLGWWSIPGLRRASRTASSFAALLLLYGAVLPVTSYAFVHTQSIAFTANPHVDTTPVAPSLPSGQTAQPLQTDAPTHAAQTSAPPPTPTSSSSTAAPTPPPSAPPAPPSIAPLSIAPPSVPAGATALCIDGTYSYSSHESGTCSHHGGVARWIHRPPG